MQQKKIYFKSDFNVILASEGGWTGVPFRLTFYTDAPTRCHVASFDGEQYDGCHLLEDGRLCIGIDNTGADGKVVMGFGTLKCAPEFYLDSDCFRDHICNEQVAPFKVVCQDEQGNEYEINLSLEGSSTLETIGTLPAYYMQGPEGKQGKQGVQGIPGKDGQDGAPGKDGKDGQDGAPGKDGKDGQDGKDGRDGRDGGLIYPSYKVDPHNMHLYSDTDTNRVALSKDKHFTVKF